MANILWLSEHVDTLSRVGAFVAGLRLSGHQVQTNSWNKEVKLLRAFDVQKICKEQGIEVLVLQYFQGNSRTVILSTIQLATEVGCKIILFGPWKAYKEPGVTVVSANTRAPELSRIIQKLL
jgi:hypothetical protein